MVPFFISGEYYKSLGLKPSAKDKAADKHDYDVRYLLERAASLVEPVREGAPGLFTVASTKAGNAAHIVSLADGMCSCQRWAPPGYSSCCKHLEAVAAIEYAAGNASPAQLADVSQSVPSGAVQVLDSGDASCTVVRVASLLPADAGVDVSKQAALVTLPSDDRHEHCSCHVFAHYHVCRHVMVARTAVAAKPLQPAQVPPRLRPQPGVYSLMDKQLGPLTKMRSIYELLGLPETLPASLSPRRGRLTKARLTREEQEQAALRVWEARREVRLRELQRQELLRQENHQHQQTHELLQAQHHQSPMPSGSAWCGVAMAGGAEPAAKRRAVASPSPALARTEADISAGATTAEFSGDLVAQERFDAEVAPRPIEPLPPLHRARPYLDTVAAALEREESVRRGRRELAEVKLLKSGPRFKGPACMPASAEPNTATLHAAGTPPPPCAYAHAGLNKGQAKALQARSQLIRVLERINFSDLEELELDDLTQHMHDMLAVAKAASAAAPSPPPLLPTHAGDTNPAYRRQPGQRREVPLHDPAVRAQRRARAGVPTPDGPTDVHEPTHEPTHMPCAKPAGRPAAARARCAVGS